jgi:predicted transcriptional regulator YdeE
MEPKLTMGGGMKVIGSEVRTSNLLEGDQTTAKIPGLWKRFLEEKLEDKIPNRTRPGNLFGVYANYESDHTGMYSLIVSAEVSSLDCVPEGMVGLTIPAGKYLVFPASGPIPDAIIQTWQIVWNYFSQSSEYRRTYVADFESYRWKPDTQQTEADIHIAVR